MKKSRFLYIFSRSYRELFNKVELLERKLEKAENNINALLIMKTKYEQVIGNGTRA